MNHRIFPIGDYRDPAEVYADAEARTCAGCSWVTKTRSWVGWITETCAQGRPFGKRCSDYMEKKGHG